MTAVILEEDTSEGRQRAAEKAAEIKVFTCPIAGTRKRGKDEKEDERLCAELLADEKE